MSDTNAPSGTPSDTTEGTGAGQSPALTLVERAAELREMADNASDFGGLRQKLDKVASFAEAVAASLTQLRDDVESVSDFNEQAALEVAQRLDQLNQAIASRPV